MSQTSSAADRPRRLALVQGIYSILSGLRPLVHMRSFLRVTGPKWDLWLVRVIGAELAVIGAALLTAAAHGGLGGPSRSPQGIPSSAHKRTNGRTVILPVEKYDSPRCTWKKRGMGVRSAK